MRGERALTVRSMRDWLAARSAVSVGYLASRSRTPAWCSRSPTARSRAGEMLVRASRRRLASRVCVGGQVDVEAVEDPQLGEQLIGAGVEPVHLLAPGPAGVGQHVGVAPVGLGLTGIQIRGAAHHQARHVRHRHARAGRRPPGRAGRSSRAGRSPGPACHAGRPGPAAPPDRAWSLATARANNRSPSSSRTSAKCSSLPTSSPTHTSTCAGVATDAPSSAVLPGHVHGKAVHGALAVIHLTNQRSSRMSPSEVHAPTVPAATPPRPYQLQGAMSHTGTAGLPKPEP